MSPPPDPPQPLPPVARTSSRQIDTDDTTCPRCGESHDLAKVKGCIKCLKCGFKFDCNGW
jgi:ribosomal protein S27AE